ncbi:MAG TPA: hypothetical protein VMT26_03715 [Candidatus Bathyarchaeia archaeon]|jgi:cellulose biosynthesis protein BcsQ|nr:hypothetical protein [Candidatus Bathyarchaeia archaeon]
MTENVQPNENKEQTQKVENQTSMVEEPEVFCPLQLDEKEMESKVEMEQKLQELLKTINEESLQLGKFLIDEGQLVNEVCTSLALVLKKLGISFRIPSRDIPFRRKVENAILNEEGKLTLTYENNEKHSAFLAEYPPEIVMAVLWIVIPELARAITVYRKKLDTRTNFFERVKKELKSVTKAIVEGNEGKQEPKKE